MHGSVIPGQLSDFFYWAVYRILGFAILINGSSSFLFSGKVFALQPGSLPYYLYLLEQGK